ncbi:MAG: hypothetical protein C6I01_07045 [Epsilonproteobacteria bacterium]|nr:hypothetical protein [Campylobacterota bacterium]NPA89194.1 hypothetical protein [Campylobacterota bacterium]
MKKKGLVLFITLAFLILAFGIVGSIATSYQKITSRDYTFIPQNGALIEDLIGGLGKVETNLSFFEQLPLTFPISSPDGEFKATIEISPVQTLNLNDYLTAKGEINSTIDHFFDYLGEKYGIEDLPLLKALILDTIDSDSISRLEGSEIGKKDPLFQNGAVYNWEQFRQILKVYQRETGDNSVEKVPWKEYFNFTITQLYNPDPIFTRFNREGGEKNFTIITPKSPHFYIWVKISYRNNRLKLLYDFKTRKVLEVEADSLY